MICARCNGTGWYETSYGTDTLDVECDHSYPHNQALRLRVPSYVLALPTRPEPAHCSFCETETIRTEPRGECLSCIVHDLEQDARHDTEWGEHD